MCPSVSMQVCINITALSAVLIIATVSSFNNSIHQLCVPAQFHNSHTTIFDISSVLLTKLNLK